MKKSLLFILIVLCASINVSQAQTTQPKDYVEVMYFYGKQRCPTCKAIEKCTKEVIDQDFKAQTKQGKVRFRIVDISTDEGEKIADKYKVTWASLFVNKWKNGKEVRKDLTQLGFQKARNNAADFKNQLKKEINNSLK